MHEIQPPLDHILQIGRRLSHDEVEGPVRGGGKGNAFRTDSQGHYLVVDKYRDGSHQKGKKGETGSRHTPQEGITKVEAPSCREILKHVDG